MNEWLADVASWAWARHHNVLSWYIRPLFFLPFCWFAWRRSGTGIALTIVALATSMAWFPAPAHPDDGVVRMLAVEREYLLGDWTSAKVATALVTPLVFGALAAALWRRSLPWALVVVDAAYLFKIAWTYRFDDQGVGADTHLRAVLLGVVVVNVVLVGAAWLVRRRAAGAPAAPRAAGLPR